MGALPDIKSGAAAEIDKAADGLVDLLALLLAERHVAAQIRKKEKT